MPSSSELGSPIGPVDTAQHPRRLESSQFDPLVNICPIRSKATFLFKLSTSQPQFLLTVALRLTRTLHSAALTVPVIVYFKFLT